MLVVAYVKSIGPWWRILREEIFKDPILNSWQRHIVNHTQFPQNQQMALILLLKGLINKKHALVINLLISKISLVHDFGMDLPLPRLRVLVLKYAD